MPLSTTVVWALGATVRETYDSADAPAMSRPVQVHDGYDSRAVLNATTVPPVTISAVKSVALVAGVKTLDLTALAHEPALTRNMTGLKLQVAKFRSPIANVHPTVIKPGASNGYVWGAAGDQITILPGQEWQWVNHLDAGPPDVAAGAKTIDVSDGGAGGTESFEYVLVFG